MALRPSRRSDTPPFIVMEVMEEAARLEAAGRQVLHMEVGQPNTPAPALARAAAVRAIEHDLLGYTLALGTPALRERIACHYRERHGVEVSPQRIAVTAGSLGAFQLAFLAAFEAGDRVAMASPGYPSYRNALKPLGVEVVELPVGEATHFQPTVEQVEEAARAGGPLQGLIVASPSNPTGSLLSPARLEGLARWCEAHEVRLVSDEIYHGITYGEEAASAASFARSAVVVNSFSKYYSMAGWRLGWMIMPEELCRPIEKLAQNFFICPSSVAAGRRAGRLRGAGRAAGARPPLRRGARHPPRRLSPARLPAHRAARRRLLRLRRRLPPRARQRRLLPAAAGRGGHRRHPGPRLRPGPRRRGGALLLRPRAGGGGRGGGAARALAAQAGRRGRHSMTRREVAG